MALRAVAAAPPRSAERVALAEAIERAAAAQARSDALARAVAQAERGVLDAVARVEEATAAVEATKLATADYLVATATGTVAGDAPPTVRQARDRLQDCQDGVDVARSTRDELKRRQNESMDPAIYRMQPRERAAGVLLAEWQGNGDALVTEAVATFAALTETGELVRQLADAGLFPTARNSLRQLVGVVGHIARLSESDAPGAAEARARGAARFRSMFEGLQADADMPLP